MEVIWSYYVILAEYQWLNGKPSPMRIHVLPLRDVIGTQQS